MSSNPTSNGGTVSKPPAAAPAIKRKKFTNDPFFKGPTKSVPKPKPQSNGHPTPSANGTIPAKAHLPRPVQPDSQRAASPATVSVNPAERVSGFSDPRVTAEGIPYRDYKLVTTKRDLLNGLRYHILHIAVDKPIDIRNEADFTKPARLHRRDPRSAPPGQPREEQDPSKDGFTAAEREELNKRKEARQKEREANLAQIAPSANAGRKMNNFKKKTQQVFRPDYSTEEKRRIQTNYEEKLPWHLEDFDNKHCLVGQNQMGSMGVHAAFAYEPAIDASTGKFRLIPVEKVYQFKPKRDIPITMTIEEVEAAMKKKGGDPEWLIRQREARMAEASREMVAKQSKGLFSGAQMQNVAGRGGEEADLDFEDDFADDEEGDLFEVKDEDEKLAEKKIKEDQLQANFLDFKDLREYDEAEEKEKKEAEARKKNFKDLRKALEKRERNYNHGSDSEYESSTDSEEERERLEKERLAALKREEEAKSVMSSGANTPSGRREKHDGSGILSDREGAAGGIKKSGSSKSLKRPGSPNLSDASGTDVSARKKKIKSRHTSSSHPSAAPSRPHSPANVPGGSQNLDPSSAALMRNRASFSGNAGSDSDGAGGAMSDSNNPRRIRLKMSSGSVSPPGAGGANLSQPTSRSGSPVPRPPSTAPAATPGGGQVAFPTAQDVMNKIPPEGISIRDLMKVVAHPKERRSEFVQLVRGVAKLDKEKGVVFLK